MEARNAIGITGLLEQLGNGDAAKQITTIINKTVEESKCPKGALTRKL
jgi:hypothetical protein